MSRDLEFIVLGLVWFVTMAIAVTYPLTTPTFDADRQALLMLMPVIVWLIGNGRLATERLDRIEDQLRIER